MIDVDLSRARSAWPSPREQKGGNRKVVAVISDGA